MDHVEWDGESWLSSNEESQVVSLDVSVSPVPPTDARVLLFQRDVVVVVDGISQSLVVFAFKALVCDAALLSLEAYTELEASSDAYPLHPLEVCCSYRACLRLEVALPPETSLCHSVARFAVSLFYPRQLLAIDTHRSLPGSRPFS